MLFKHLDAEVAPADLGAGEGFVSANAMNLQANESGGGEGVLEIGTGDAV